MPELPDVTVYVERLMAKVGGKPLNRVRLASPFVLRTAVPPIASVHGQVVREVRRLGKRLVLVFDGGLFLVIHLMVAGRLKWRKPGAAVTGQGVLAAFDFDDGTILFTEVSKKKRASIHVVQGDAALAVFDKGGLDPLTATEAQVAQRLRTERHTLKRSLTDPTLFDGIGGAYGDEILFAAKLSPVVMSDSLDETQVARLTACMRTVLLDWVERHRKRVGEGFPEEVTAFQPEMAVHGKFGTPCPVCASPIQRIVFADRETNYCATCQTDGKLLRDRALSQLLKKDWPENLEELAAMKRW